MAEEQRPGLFREKSLERLSSPERLDQLLTLVDRKTWVPLSTLGALVLILCVWSVIGHIPVTVEGRGVLLRPRKVVDVDAPGPGYLVRLEVAVGDTIPADTVIARIERPGLDKQLELQRAKLAELTELSHKAGELRDSRTAAELESTRRQSGHLARHIRELQVLADDLKQESLRALEEERALAAKQVGAARQHSDSLEQRLERQRGLQAEGLISTEEFDLAQDAWVESLERLAESDVRLHALEARELEIEEAWVQRRQRIAELTFDLNTLEVRERELAQENQEAVRDYEQELADVRREILTLETAEREEGSVVSEFPGTVVELTAGLGQFLVAGARVASMSVDEAGSPLESVTYFTVRDGKRIEPDDPIRITPDTVERARYGGIVGQVTRVSPYPVTLAEAARVVGNQELAETLLRGGHTIQVFGTLARAPDDAERFVWSSSRGPEPGLISSGTTTTGRATVEHRRPIAYVLPFLRSSTGVDG